MSKLCIFIIFIIFPFFVFASESSDCGNNKQAKILSKLIRSDIEQKRTNIRCNRILTKAAVAKAKKMAEFGLVMHNLGGSPNSRLRNAGYKLPEYYGSDFNSNQVEAIAGGYVDASEVWDYFKQSKDHRMHLLGEHKFYLEQDEMGVAFIKEKGATHIEYWVVYLTKGYQKDQPSSGKFSEIPNKASFMLIQSK